MTSAPSSSAAFWEQTEAQLAETPPDITLERDAFYSQPEWDVFRMHYNSSGGHRLYAWFSVPHGDGPFPALVRMPDYGSVHDIIYTPLRQHAVVMNPTYRGQRNSDVLVRAAYPGLLTDGIDSAETYTLLGAYADALRAIDILREQQQVQIGAIALTGAGLGAALALATAAHRSGIAAVAADTPMALGHPTALQPGLGYPLGELGDYLRAYPDSLETVAGITSLVDPIGFAGSVQAPVLMSAGRFDRSLCPLSFAEALAAALPDCDLRVYEGAAEGGGHEHGQVRGAWLAEKLGVSR
ncbi:MAG: acetylxylan esterase [Chloroflexi bacterium]|nr:acetylxylan esterase [Chloroflexota bacterium]